MSDIAIPHAHVHQQYAPDPVTSKGGPVPPGKLAIWLFLATEVMFFVGLLGTYIVLRSGSPRLFEAHGAMLSKTLAGVNTLVLIFSSLTMALAVDASAKGNRKRTAVCLAITILMAFGFMVIKYIEYTDKFGHYTVLAKDSSPVLVSFTSQSDIQGGNVYAIVRDSGRRAVVVNGDTAGRAVTASKANWASLVIPLKPAADGQFTGTVPTAAAGNASVEIYATKPGAEPTNTDKKLTPAKLDWPGGIYIYDGHVHKEAHGETEIWKLDGHRRPVARTEPINVHTWTPPSTSIPAASTPRWTGTSTNPSPFPRPISTTPSGTARKSPSSTTAISPSPASTASTSSAASSPSPSCSFKASAAGSSPPPSNTSASTGTSSISSGSFCFRCCT